MIVCPVALLADAGVWLFRAGLVMLLRLSSAVALAATAFCLTVMAANHFEQVRATASAADVPAEPIRIAFVIP